jgi:putative GTP pyrophosphokinase
MINSLSKSQIDHFGNRLREKKISEEDLKLLDEYRRSFGKAYETVVADIRQRLNLEPTGRPAKSTSSIIEKLKRESIRLTQIQDIAGCRIVLSNLTEQDRVVKSLIGLFPRSRIVDRRKKPSHGYRAVHVIADFENFPIEIQIRTTLQHLWAELSEKLSDSYDPAIKYGGGDSETRKLLNVSCETISTS